jgi:hypothetical protein
MSHSRVLWVLVSLYSSLSSTARPSAVLAASMACHEVKHQRPAVCSVNCCTKRVNRATLSWMSCFIRSSDSSSSARGAAKPRVGLGVVNIGDSMPENRLEVPNIDTGVIGFIGCHLNPHAQRNYQSDATDVPVGC